MKRYPGKERGWTDPSQWEIKPDQITGFNYTNRPTSDTTDLPHRRLFDLSQPKNMSKKEFSERCDRFQERELQQRANKRNRRTVDHAGN